MRLLLLIHRGVITTSKSMLLLFFCDRQLMSVMLWLNVNCPTRSIIYAAHREGARDATSGREYHSVQLLLLLKKKISLELTTAFIDTVSLPVTDYIAGLIIVCDDVLRDCPHCWRVQRHGRFLRTEKQVSMILLVSSVTAQPHLYSHPSGSVPTQAPKLPRVMFLWTPLIQVHC